MGDLHTNHRLQHWDYSQDGFYYVTVCTAERRPLLGSIVYDDASIDQPATVAPSALGIACENARTSINRRGMSAKIEKLIIMPDYLHMLVGINALSGLTAMTLGKTISAFKRNVTRQAKELGHSGPLWQRSYYDHVVRDDEDVSRIMEYMDNNPLRWALRARGESV